MIPIENMRFTGIERKTIWFMLGAALALLLLIGTVALKQNYFSQTTSLYFFTHNAQGLSKGMAVKFMGFKVGSVQDISMEQNAAVKVKLVLQNDYVHLIGRDAKARLVKEVLVGESVVEIIPGLPQARQVAQNDVLAFERGPELGELAEGLAGQVQPILADIKKFTSTLSGADEDIRQALKNINIASAELVETTRQMKTLAQNGNATLGVANHSIKLLDQAIPGMVQKIDASLDNIQVTTTEIRKMTFDAAEQVPHILSNSNALVQDSREIVSGVKKSWPIRNLVTEPKERILPLDGYAMPQPQSLNNEPAK